MAQDTWFRWEFLARDDFMTISYGLEFPVLERQQQQPSADLTTVVFTGIFTAIWQIENS